MTYLLFFFILSSIVLFLCLSIVSLKVNSLTFFISRLYFLFISSSIIDDDPSAFYSSIISFFLLLCSLSFPFHALLLLPFFYLLRSSVFFQPFHFSHFYFSLFRHLTVIFRFVFFIFPLSLLFVFFFRLVVSFYYLTHHYSFPA